MRKQRRRSAARFVSDLVGNPEDRYSHNEAQFCLGQKVLSDLSGPRAIQHISCFFDVKVHAFVLQLPGF